MGHAHNSIMLHYSRVIIEYASPDNLSDAAVVPYKLLDNAVVPKWIERVLTAQQNYQIDNPSRFYGFGTVAEQEELALRLINTSIATINSFSTLIHRTITSVHDQDTLNYLHHIFEVHHGLLGKQDSEFWKAAPPNVRTAIADLNINVHRCEAAARGGDNRRHVVTYYGLPKDKVLDEADYSLFTTMWAAGTIMLNYVEVGKTVEALALDNDSYIADDAFQPFRHYSADFVVKLSETSWASAASHLNKINNYYKSHIAQFGQWQPCYASGSIPLAVVVNQSDLAHIEKRQYVKAVSFN